jgi:hypothetical protein
VISDPSCGTENPDRATFIPSVDRALAELEP